jgi:hypothetical protein
MAHETHCLGSYLAEGAHWQQVSTEQAKRDIQAAYRSGNHQLGDALTRKMQRHQRLQARRHKQQQQQQATQQAPQQAPQPEPQHQQAQEQLPCATAEEKTTNEEEGLLEVESILDCKGHGADRRFLVAWMGYSAEHNTWESRSSFVEPSEMLADFEAKVDASAAALI